MRKGGGDKMWRVDRAIIVLAGAGVIGIFMIVFGPRIANPWSTIITNIGMGLECTPMIGQKGLGESGRVPPYFVE